MHIKQRLSIVALALVSFMPLFSVELRASLMEKHQAAEELDIVLKEAESVQHAGSGLFYEKSRAEKQMQELGEQVEAAQFRKTQARRKLVLVHRHIQELNDVYGIDATNTGALIASIEQEEENVSAFLRYVARRQFTLAMGGSDFGVTLAQHLLSTSLGEITDSRVHSRAVTYARLRVFKTALLAKQLGDEARLLEGEYQQELKHYEEVWQQYLEAKQGVSSAQARIAEVQR
ncbi:MAG: hypothetical protein KC680_01880, partial [Candidatus Peregrinibacteria bacterium]|nr:hypothetical protein [Candidatus Peregrinibacteria bacterium]